MKQISRSLPTIDAAERFQDILYGEYDYVRLVRSPIGELGVYVWEVKPEEPVCPFGGNELSCECEACR